MVKLKGKKKVEDDKEDFVVEEQHDEKDDNKHFESKFKSLRARTTVLPLYDATQSLSPERKSKIREMGFASMLDFPFQKTL
nr:200 kDa antigen p200 [Tanacetum cinerariifolium]